MERSISSSELKNLAEFLSKRAEELNYVGDLSDLGNEIGFALGELYDSITENETKDIVRGLKHGISLTNGTH